MLILDAPRKQTLKCIINNKSYADTNDICNNIPNSKVCMKDKKYSNSYTGAARPHNI